MRSNAVNDPNTRNPHPPEAAQPAPATDAVISSVELVFGSWGTAELCALTEPATTTQTISKAPGAMLAMDTEVPSAISLTPALAAPSADFVHEPETDQGAVSLMEEQQASAACEPASEDAGPPPYDVHDECATVHGTGLASYGSAGFWFQGFFFPNLEALLAYRRAAIAYNFHYFGIRHECRAPAHLPRPRAPRPSTASARVTAPTASPARTPSSPSPTPSPAPSSPTPSALAAPPSPTAASGAATPPRAPPSPVLTAVTPPPPSASAAAHIHLAGACGLLASPGPGLGTGTVDYGDAMCQDACGSPSSPTCSSGSGADSDDGCLFPHSPDAEAEAEAEAPLAEEEACDSVPSGPQAALSPCGMRASVGCECAWGEDAEAMAGLAAGLAGTSLPEAGLTRKHASAEAGDGSCGFGAAAKRLQLCADAPELGEAAAPSAAPAATAGWRHTPGSGGSGSGAAAAQLTCLPLPPLRCRVPGGAAPVGFCTAAPGAAEAPSGDALGAAFAAAAAAAALGCGLAGSASPTRTGEAGDCPTWLEPHIGGLLGQVVQGLWGDESDDEEEGEGQGEAGRMGGAGAQGSGWGCAGGLGVAAVAMRADATMCG
ncbi:hypothetical protein HYH03_006246 [Edaphochlamys debaryana]|uniref:Uncharacterized protein n=1 Tax=Edaphochlamys debaryana TaxID=47281 RepID=A0A835Y461_9CHLO|nr:hypothetical protein HYH03_006246 [Edaphochlamys debaryana]|eukprot:KAG2495646.1 hypothetical protein HYH03_006246 [Edaphochlamys debaryana]